MGKHKTRNHEWLDQQIDRLIALGDRRPRKTLAEEIKGTNDIKSAEIGIAESTAHREVETGNGEVVVHRKHHYPYADLHEGEVLHHGNAFLHPVLARQ
jgi:hypothetical protein